MFELDDPAIMSNKSDAHAVATMQSTRNGWRTSVILPFLMGFMYTVFRYGLERTYLELPILANNNFCTALFVCLNRLKS